MKLKSLSLSVMVGLTFGLPVPAAMASGYHFGSQSVSAQGTSHANSAEAADASVLFYNPAGMSLLDGTQFAGGLTLSFRTRPIPITVPPTTLANRPVAAMAAPTRRIWWWRRRFI